MDERIIKDVESFLPWLRNLEAVAYSLRGRYGLDDETLSQITGARAPLESALHELSQAEEEARSANAMLEQARAMFADANRQQQEAQAAISAAAVELDNALKDASDRAFPLVERLKTNRQTPTADYSRSAAAESSVQLSAPRAVGASTSTPALRTGTQPSALSSPASLSVTPQPGRAMVLQWDTAGNDLSTGYVVEAAVGAMYRGSATEPDASAYKALAFVATGATFRHDASRIPAGSKVKYRVRAKRGDVVGGYSNEVLIVAK